jgi:hypothetical protein
MLRDVGESCQVHSLLLPEHQVLYKNDSRQLVLPVDQTLELAAMTHLLLRHQFLIRQMHLVCILTD